jgi:transposase
VKEWADIRHLQFSEGLSIRAIATRLGVARDTVTKALALEGPPTYSRPPVVLVFDPFEVRVRQLLAEFLSMPATVGDC